MKTLLLVLNINDAGWLTEVWNKYSRSGNVVVIAPNFDGRFVAESLGIPYKSYEDISWTIDKLKITDISRNKARYWHEIDGIHDNIYVNSIKEFNGFPVLVMEQSLLFLAVQEIIQAHTLVHKIIEQEQPDEIYYNERANPFLNLPIKFICDCNTVEREIVKSIKNRANQLGNYSEFINSLDIKYPRPTSAVVNDLQFNWPPYMTGPKILIYAIGGYHYFEYIANIINLLIQNKAKICIVVMEDWEHTLPMQSRFEELGVYLIDRKSLKAINEEAIWSAWKLKCDKAIESLYCNKLLEEYFSDDFGTYYPGLVSNFLCKQILDTSTTIINLLRAESLITELNPDVVLYHANIHSSETCDILPARKRGIPTLAIDHGVNGYFDAQRMTFATEYYGASGVCLKDALVSSIRAPESAIFVTGNTRCEKIKPSNMSVREAKQQLGLDPNRPLCIFCDQSGWSHMYEWRHSTFTTVQKITELKTAFPELQIIYRIHAGRNYDGMRLYFERLAPPGVTLQYGYDPILTDVLPAADIVISHYSTAISESLLSGVPVIYLTATGEPEPSYCGCGAINIVRSFPELAATVQEVLLQNLSREEVRELAQPFFDVALAGSDGQESKRLSDLIMSLAATPKDQRTVGFADWLSRIETSCQFNTKEFRKMMPTAKELAVDSVRTVSVIIPTYNRRDLLNLTINSFMGQHYPIDKFEIIIADNNSSDGTRDLVAMWQKKSPIKIKYVYEGRQSAHFARNTAAKQATGEILYFTDDDMIADAEMLMEITSVFDLDPKIGAATGRVLPKWEVEPPEWIVSLCTNGLLSLNDQGEGIHKINDLSIWSCHQAVNREAFFKSEGFNPDVIHGLAVGDNEAGLNIKLEQLGYILAYNGRAITHHIIPSTRMTQEYLNKRLAQQGSCNSYTEYRKYKFSDEQLSNQITEHHTQLATYSRLSLNKQAAGDTGWHIDKAYVYYFLNRIEYDFKLLTDSQWRRMVLHNNWISDDDKFDQLFKMLAPITDTPFRRIDENKVSINLRDFGYEAGNRTDNLKQFQRQYGFSIIPVSYEEPVPDLRDVNIHDEYNHDKIQEINFKYDDSWIDAATIQRLDVVPDEIQNNPMIAKKDLQVYGYFIHQFRPKRIVEIGSGYSGCFASMASHIYSVNADIYCIEPSPNPFLLQIAGANYVTLIQKKVQNITNAELQLISDLNKNDILFVDASHITVRSSDTNFIFINLLPMLKSGVVVHFHDVFLPYDYINNYYSRGWFWNEQYLLAAILANSDHFEPLYSTYSNHVDHGGGYGGSFWMRVK